MNYVSTFIRVATDTKATAGKAPPERAGNPTVAALEYALISQAPYTLTQEEVQFRVHLLRTGKPVDLAGPERQALWDAFFSKEMACLRASPLPKTYGWGVHFNSEGHVALVDMASDAYADLAADGEIKQTQAMRSRR